MICILHGYLLDGSGSNLWTRSIVQSLCRQGETVHLVCQEPHPEQFDFIAEAFRYDRDGQVQTLFRRDVPYPGKCVMHKPEIGDTLPVYVWDKYEEFPNVVPMVDLPDGVIEEYLRLNTEAVLKASRHHDFTVIHANHAVLMSVVAQRVSRQTGIPFAIMPHGSAIEYAVKKDARFLRFAASAFTDAKKVFVVGREMRQRVNSVLGAVPDIDAKLIELNLGVDTSLFEPIPTNLRRNNIENLLQALEAIPRGKSPELSQALVQNIAESSTLHDLLTDIQASRDYTAKLPDSDLEVKLRQVNWEEDEILLFVGRIIASKGLQSILAAMPLILAERPNARLLVVGHGPLREPLEAMLGAMQHHQRKLVEQIVDWGTILEGLGEKPLTEVRAFFSQLEAQGELDSYFEKAAQYVRPERVIFTGYLTHRELRYLFPSCDIAIFPSVVAESGPLVFLEALASGCFPLGTYFAGMAASIDSAATVVPAEVADLMKLSPDEEKTAADIAAKAGKALSVSGRYREPLRHLAVQNYDWTNIARRLASHLRSLA